MITEDYVSFEISKLLKEKGFNVETEHKMWYVVKQFSTGCHWNSCTYKVGDITREYDEDCCIPMPTLQMAMKWLREVHNIHIVVHPYTDKEGHHFSFLFDSYAYGCWQELGIYITDSWSTYEEAGEAAVKYCLENLI